jgi:hypothetical protein
MFISSLINSINSDNSNSNSNNSNGSNVKVSCKLMMDRLLLEPLVLGYVNKNLLDTGSYIMIINAENEGGATGIFCISRSQKSEMGNIIKLVANDGIYNERLNIEWDPYEYPKIVLYIHKLKKDKIQNKREIKFSYNVKIV